MAVNKIESPKLLEAIDLDEEEQVLNLLSSTKIEDSKHNHKVQWNANTKLSSPRWGTFTLLHWAAQKGFVRTIQFLLQQPASDPNAADDAGDTALHHAARFHSTSVVQLLLEHYASHIDITAVNRVGDTPLHLAVVNGAAKIVKLLAHAPSAINLQNNAGNTPLHLAASCANVLIVKLLLTSEAIDVFLKNADGDTPLHVAVARGKIGSVQALLTYNSGADVRVDIRNNAKLTPLHLACCGKSSYSCLATWATPLDRALKERHASPEDLRRIVELLVQEGADTCSRDGDGNTPLHFAARSGYGDAIHTLLSSPLATGARQEDTGNVGDVARTKFMTWATQALLEADSGDGGGFDFYSAEWNCTGKINGVVDVRNKEGCSALHMAAWYGQQAAASALVDHGASMNVLDKYMESPLDKAFKAGKDNVVSLLIRRGAEISNCVKTGMTEMASAVVDATRSSDLIPKKMSDLHGGSRDLLHAAAMAGRTKITEALLEVEDGGWDVNMKNVWKQTALHCAAILGQTEVVLSLCHRQDLRANEEDKRGKTALQYAVECKHPKIEKILLERSDVKESVERLYRDRQVYVDAANAMLVAAALIGGVTFAGWLQPPRGYSSSGQMDTRPTSVRVFCIFNALSFCFAMCTVLGGAGAILPRPGLYIATVVLEVRRALALAALFMVISIGCVLVAFTAAGFAVVGMSNGLSLIGGSVTPGVVISVGLMAWFVTKMAALLPVWVTNVLPVSFVHLLRQQGRGVKSFKEAESSSSSLSINLRS